MNEKSLHLLKSSSGCNCTVWVEANPLPDEWLNRNVLPHCSFIWHTRARNAWAVPSEAVETKSCLKFMWRSSLCAPNVVWWSPTVVSDTEMVCIFSHMQNAKCSRFKWTKRELFYLLCGWQQNETDIYEHIMSFMWQPNQYHTIKSFLLSVYYDELHIVFICCCASS